MLQKFLASYKLKLYGKMSISIGKLKQWCAECELLPEDMDTVHVAKHDLS